MLRMVFTTFGYLFGSNKGERNRSNVGFINKILGLFVYM